VNRKRGDLPVGGIESSLERCVLRCRRKELNASDEQIESERENVKIVRPNVSVMFKS